MLEKELDCVHPIASTVAAHLLPGSSVSVAIDVAVRPATFTASHLVFSMTDELRDLPDESD